MLPKWPREMASISHFVFAQQPQLLKLDSPLEIRLFLLYYDDTRSMPRSRLLLNSTQRFLTTYSSRHERKCLSVTCQDNQLCARLPARTGEDALAWGDALRMRRHAHHGR